jgi:hypothetical protein
MWDEKKNKSTDHASWTQSLTSVRDNDTKGWSPDGPLDLLVLTGSGRFWNSEDGSSLQGDTLKVWVMPREPEGDAAAKSQPASQPAPRPRRVDAIGHVFSSSRELIIHDTSRLKVIFKDAPPGTLPPAPETAKPPRRAEPLLSGQSQMTGPPPMAPGDAPKDAPPKAEEPRPMYLSASRVEATVLRGEPKNILEDLWCEGRVHVRQAGDPVKKDDKGLDIKGSTLKIKWYPQGNELTVSSDDKSLQANEDDLAQMLFKNLYIIGQTIEIDQKEDTVSVPGAGAMMMESATTLAGTPAKEPIPLTIHWTERMLFKGQTVMYSGEIQADQDNARWACAALTVFFDRYISLKEGGNKGENGKKDDKDDKSPRVETLICDRAVQIEEATPALDKTTGKPLTDRKTGKPLIDKYHKIVAPWVRTEVNDKEPGELKDTNMMRASAPGKVWLFERGGTDPLAPPPDAAKPKPAPKPGEEDEMKLTYVEYGKSMMANNKTGRANFWGGVRVLNTAESDLRIEPNLDEMMAVLPKGAMYLAADQLEVIGRKTADGKSSQEMTATYRVWVKSNEYEASCNTLHFDEAKDQVIFRGSENGLATLTRTLKKGVQPEIIKGKEIINIRSTGAFKVDGSPLIRN